MTNDAQRILRLENTVAKMAQQIQALQTQVNAIAANQFNPLSGLGGGGGISATAYVCVPTGTVSAATYSGTTLTAVVTFSATVYQIQNTTITSLGSQTCINGLADTLDADFPCPCVPDGQGNYLVVSQGCTSV
jgi:hypothetical protein